MSSCCIDTRNFSYITWLLPCLSQVRALSITIFLSTHHTLVTVVKYLTAQLVRECSSQAQVLIANVEVETTEHVRSRSATPVILSISIVVSIFLTVNSYQCLSVCSVAWVILFCVRNPETITCCRVYTTPLTQPEFVHRLTFHPLLSTIDVTIFLHFFRQCHQLVLQECSVSTYWYVPILVLEYVVVQFNFNTWVRNLTDVLSNRSHTCRTWLRFREQQVLRVLTEVFDRTCQLVEQTEFNTEVSRNLSFPLQVRVSDIEEVSTCFATIVVTQTVQCLIWIVRRQLVITCFTVRSTDLQVVQPFYILHEFFFSHTPASTEWPEVTPTVILVETWRTVTTVRHRSVVLISIVVVQTSEVTFLLVFVCIRRYRRDVYEVIEFIDTTDNFSVLHRVQVFVLVTIAFVTNHCVNSVLTEITVVRYQLVQSLSDSTSRQDIETSTRSTVTYQWVFVYLTTTVNVVVRVVSSNIQTFDREECYICINSLLVTLSLTFVEQSFSECITTSVSQTLAIIVINILRRICCYVTISIQIFTSFQVVLVNWVVRSHVADETSQVVVWTRRVWVRSRVLRQYARQRHVQTSLEPLNRIYVVVQTTWVTFEVSLLHVTLIVQVRYRSVSVALFSLSVVAQHIFLTVTSAVSFLFPIQVITPLQVIHACSRINLTVNTYDSVVSNTLVWVVNQQVAQTRSSLLSSSSSVVASCNVRVLTHLPLIFEPIVQTSLSIVAISDVRETLVNCQVEVCTTVTLTFLSSDQNHTVTSWRTVQWSRSSVLQDSHRFDIGRVDITQRTVIDSTIHYIKRSRRSINRTETTDTDRSWFTWLTSSRSYLNTGSITFEGRSYVSNGTLFEGLSTYGRSRTGERRLLGSTISYDYHFVDNLSVGMHNNLLRSRSSDRYFYSTHTYIRNNKRLASCWNVLD